MYSEGVNKNLKLELSPSCFWVVFFSALMFEMVASIQLICSTSDSMGSVSQEIMAGSTFPAQSIAAARQA